ncbi:MAG TPA: tRNA-guanine transglycosylase, partial [Rhizomicrobium sp.]|nr:tRNA-guanine transglycosylase [Rhizomicrobium sp.]
DCHCPACRQFSRAYLHHTVKSGEIIAAMLLTWHNLTHYQRLMDDLRQAISQARLSDWLRHYRAAGKMSGDV